MSPHILEKFGRLATREMLCQHSNMTLNSSAITFDPARRGGRACVRDLRIAVGDVLGWLAVGMTVEQILADYPELSADDITACLAYAASRESHEVRISSAA